MRTGRLFDTLSATDEVHEQSGTEHHSIANDSFATVLELVAQGPEPRQRWKTRLEPDHTLVLGRAPEADLPVPWEEFLSGKHAELNLHDSVITITCLPRARNSLFSDGKSSRSLKLRSGEQFVVGRTSFHLVEASVESTPDAARPMEELTFTRQQLDQVRFGDADRRIEVLSRLPEVIASARDLHERDARLVALVLSGIRSADAVAVVELHNRSDVQLGAWERRLETAGSFRPSSRLVAECLGRSRGTMLHVWTGSDTSTSDYTQLAEVDWAFCTPLTNHNGRRWGLYVTGRIAGQTALGGRIASTPQLQQDVKFTELVADIISSVLRLGKLEANVAVLQQFLAPPLVTALERASTDGQLDPSLLEPRECAVTVLFCDLRGFSQRAEEASHDLAGLLGRVSAALAIMTQQITASGGVTGDFLGDATLGFWGWPFASEEAPLNACRAALAIRREFASLQTDPDHPLADFEIGIGIAHGRAMAGKIGTQDRMTVTVFGPVVNLASRLEGLTRQLHVPILLDEATADIVGERLSESEGRTRRLARLLPYGMETPLTVSELLPSFEEFPNLTSVHLHRYEQGLDAFLAGHWEDAYRCLHDIPSSDRAQDFLLLRITQNNRTAPPGWNGIIRMPGK